MRLLPPHGVLVDLQLLSALDRAAALSWRCSNWHGGTGPTPLVTGTDSRTSLGANDEPWGARHYYSFVNPRIVEQYGVNEGTTEDVLSMQELPFGTSSGPYTLERRDATGTRVERWPDYHKHTPADDKFHDKRSRQALQKAFDYEGFIAALRPFGGTYQGPISNLLSHFALSQDEIRSYYRHDPAEARALWAAADFEYPVDNIKVFMSTGNALQQQIAEFMAQSLAESLGLPTEVEAVDVNT